MPIKLENVGIAVADLDATIAFFVDLGLTVIGRDTVSGEWTDTAVGLDGNHAKIAMLQTSPSPSTTSTPPSRWPRHTDAIRCAVWRTIKTSTGSPICEAPAASS